MCPLKNVKHEVFAQQLVHGQKFGWTRGACYSRAGYKAEGESAEVSASRLLNNVKNGVAARVQEIVGAGAKRAAVTVESLMDELNAVLNGAVDAKQFGAARAAIDTKARLKGLMHDRVEIGRVGEFDEPLSVDSVARNMLDGMPLDEVLQLCAEIREAVLRIASERAQLVIPSASGTSVRSTNETAKALVPSRQARVERSRHR
jgi:hypothetical protein